MSITDSNPRSGETMAGSWQVDPQRSSVEFRVGNFGAWHRSRATSATTKGKLDLGADPAIELADRRRKPGYRQQQ